MWSVHFLGILLSTAKAPTSPSFPSPSLVLSQVLLSVLHQVPLRAGHGLPSSKLLCRGSGVRPADRPRTSQGHKDPISLPLARREGPTQGHPAGSCRASIS
ncbi:hypothetical protein CIB84_011347 [Bambusicola thoracicus]|uniref:Uncharacterized protein n=1 Tax=Bambusicola thoracicus TaxID=9083 RepID=A0A2P4SLC7_BAMTH|nr:hypothetical protein CIB84_011347 [Bambusicola thoracicus]